MTKIVFTGPEDIRILAHEDLETHAGVDEFRKTSFHKGKPVEVSDEVFLALTTMPEIFGNFEEFVLGEKPSVTKSAEAKQAEDAADPMIANATAADAVAAPTKTKTSGSTSSK